MSSACFFESLLPDALKPFMTRTLNFFECFAVGHIAKSVLETRYVDQNGPKLLTKVHYVH